MIPESDADVPAWWSSLGLPGLVDVHVHFLPPGIQRAVYEVFDAAGPKIGQPWPITYRGTHEERVDQLRALGVRRFGALPYAHKPGVATYLNDWARDFAARTPDAFWSATLYPEPEAATYVTDLVAAGAEVFKVHVQVGEFALDDPLIDEAWGTLADAGTPVVIHAGSGPVGNAFTGPGSLARVLQQHPRLTAVVAHMGAPEYADFLALAERYERTHLDTTMVWTDFFEALDHGHGGFPADLLPRVVDLGPKVLLGSDFPTIPYPYAHQLEALTRLRDLEPRLDDDWLREVCWHTPVRLLGDPLE
ncbi:amidohydrolase [Nocardioides mangrovicus]|uniref:Amidohydrolase n=1 Tax=Nocardioides mangrovicus TaxID=2478913 RepID=A0A3L8P3J4_9ACTN|nr:amidohydrolase family protein [Nocardioides mangrovicus]RLV49835.1 amidohydrolase [Nocardioides mangrovicus]